VADGGHFENRKISISQQRLRKIGILTMQTVKKSNFKKFNKVDGSHTEKSPYLSNSLADHHEICHNDALCPCE